MTRIVSTRTLHVPAANFKPHEIDPVTGGHKREGNYAVDEVPPGTPVEIDDKEAERLLKTHPEFFVLAPEPEKPAVKGAAG